MSTNGFAPAVMLYPQHLLVIFGIQMHVHNVILGKEVGGGQHGNGTSTAN